MTTKLHINASQGIIDVEGDVDFVEKVYSDFKEKIEAMLSNPPNDGGDPLRDNATSEAESQPKSKTAKKKRSPKRAATDNGGDKSAAPAYKPALDKSVSLQGLKPFYDKYSPKNNSERILLFCKFLKNTDQEPCSADQIYTCYLKTDPKKLPKAYQQALIDTRGKDKGYIEYNTFDAISLSHIGEHHFVTDLEADD